MQPTSPAGRDTTDALEPELGRLGLEASGKPLPSGSVTFLFTDIEGSTALWQRLGETFRASLERHHALLLAEFARVGGRVFKETGDGFLVAFESACAAVACAIACQRVFTQQDWPSPIGTLWVRIAIHTGDVFAENGDYHSLVLHHTARLMGAAHGGQILCSAAAAAALLGGDSLHSLETHAELRDLGLYRLRDVPGPQRVFAVCYPDQPERGQATPRADRAYTPSLPVSLTRFFGREEELARLETLLAPGNETRLVTLTGSGGTGKTRLAVEAANRMIVAYDGAVWFVPLADVADPRLLADAILDALPNVPAAPDEPLQRIVQFLSAQPSLLVLDNAEHLVDATAEFAQAVVTRAPDAVCLVTSRQQLNIGGERDFPVAPLPVPTSTGGGDQVAVRLFLDRAQTARSDFAISDASAPAIAGICARLEGIPLAIELAAARVSVLTPPQILAQLENRFRLLVTSRRDVPARHRSLRAAIEYSYDLLGPDLQRFFRTLSVFRGGFTLEAAEHASDDPFALDHLDYLRRCSLLIAEQSGSEETAEMRFRLLESLRAFADEHLTDDERATALERHREWFLSLAERAEPELSGPDQADWLHRLEAEHDNLRAALSLPRHDEAHMRLAAALHRFWMVHGHLREGREWLEAALARCSQTSEIVRAKALNGAGIIALSVGDLSMARIHFEQSLDAYKRQTDTLGAIKVLSNLGIAASQQGDFIAAREAFQTCLVYYRAAGDFARAASVLTNLGAVAGEQADYESARTFFEECLPYHRQHGDKFVLASTLNNAAEVAVRQGDYLSARQLFSESLTLRQELGDQNMIALSLFNLAGLAILQECYERAAILFGAAESLRELQGTALAPVDQPKYSRDLDTLVKAVSEETRGRLWVTGRVMTAEEAISYALEPDLL